LADETSDNRTITKKALDAVSQDCSYFGTNTDQLNVLARHVLPTNLSYAIETLHHELRQSGEHLLLTKVTTMDNLEVQQT
jgi:hypothetical protein